MRRSRAASVLPGCSWRLDSYGSHLGIVRYRCYYYVRQCAAPHCTRLWLRCVAADGVARSVSLGRRTPVPAAQPFGRPAAPTCAATALASEWCPDGGVQACTRSEVNKGWRALRPNHAPTCRLALWYILVRYVLWCDTQKGASQLSSSATPPCQCPATQQEQLPAGKLWERRSKAHLGGRRGPTGGVPCAVAASHPDQRVPPTSNSMTPACRFPGTPHKPHAPKPCELTCVAVAAHQTLPGLPAAVCWHAPSHRRWRPARGWRRAPPSPADTKCELVL